MSCSPSLAPARLGLLPTRARHGCASPAPAVRCRDVFRRRPLDNAVAERLPVTAIRLFRELHLRVDAPHVLDKMPQGIGIANIGVVVPVTVLVNDDEPTEIFPFVLVPRLL